MPNCISNSARLSWRKRAVQARGNSGVYVQGRYEIQVLDCFGLPPADNGSGGIYKVAVPQG